MPSTHLSGPSRTKSITALLLLGAVSLCIGCGSSSGPDPGMAIEFLGDGGSVEFSEALIGNRTTFTVEFWIKAEWPPISGAPNPERNAIYMEGSNSLQRNRIFISGDNPDNPDDDAGTTTVTSWPSDVAPTVFAGPLTESVWQHVAYVRDGGTLRIYIDGVLDAEGTAVTYTGGEPTGSRLGLVLNSISGDEWGQFTIDELRVSSVARYSGNFSPPFVHRSDAQTLSLWRFDEFSGTATVDETGQQPDAIVSVTVQRVMADR